MTVVKARDFKQEQRGIVFDFKDIASEANTMLEAARAESKRILDEARKKTELEREKIYKQAYDEGYSLGQKKGYDDAYSPAQKKGYDAGYAQALAEVKERFELHINEPLEDTRAILEYFDSNKKRLLWQAEQSFVVLAIKLAEKVIRQKIELHPELVKDTVRAALETVARTTNVVIRVSPDDISIIEDLKGSLSDILGRFTSVSITPDETINRGGCVLQTERGKVDARIEKQIDRIARDILEPGAVLEIEDESDSLSVDKLIEDSSQQEEVLNPVVPTALVPEAIIDFPLDEEIELELSNLESEGSANPLETETDNQEGNEPEVKAEELPTDQAERLRRQMKDQAGQDDQS